jgi:hypothetical protein
MKYKEVHTNVFADWKVDTDETYKEIVDLDKAFWKVPKFIKDPEDVEKIE